MNDRIFTDLPPPPDYSLDSAEREAVVRAMRFTKGNKRSAARALGIGKTTLYRKLSTHNISPSEYGTE